MLRTSFVPLALTIAMIASPASAASQGAEPRNEAGVLAASDDWIAAERMGNVAELNQRLAADYCDVESNGRAHPKAELLAHTAGRKDIWPGTPAEVAAAFHKQHPSIKKVVIHGDTAILSYYPANPNGDAYVLAEDIFAYEHGRWTAVISNHFNVPPAGSS